MRNVILSYFYQILLTHQITHYLSHTVVVPTVKIIKVKLFPKNIFPDFFHLLCRCYWVFFDLRVLHTLMLSCFERKFILLFPLLGEINYFATLLWHIHEQMHYIAKVRDTHMLQPVSRLVRQAVNRTMDQ